MFFYCNSICFYAFILLLCNKKQKIRRSRKYYKKLIVPSAITTTGSIIVRVINVDAMRFNTRIVCPGKKNPRIRRRISTFVGINVEIYRKIARFVHIAVVPRKYYPILFVRPRFIRKYFLLRRRRRRYRAEYEAEVFRFRLRPETARARIAVVVNLQLRRRRRISRAQKRYTGSGIVLARYNRVYGVFTLSSLLIIFPFSTVSFGI